MYNKIAKNVIKAELLQLTKMNIKLKKAILK